MASSGEHDLFNQVGPLLGSLGTILVASLTFLATADGVAAFTATLASSAKAAQAAGYKRDWTRVLPSALLAVITLKVAMAGICVTVLLAGQLRPQEWYTVYRGALHLATGAVAGAGAAAAGKVMRATGADILKETAVAGNHKTYAVAVILHAVAAASLMSLSLFVSIYYIYSK